MRHYFQKELGYFTFSSFKVFLELLLGSMASLVPLTAAMIAVAGARLLDVCIGCLVVFLMRQQPYPMPRALKSKVCLVKLSNCS